MRTHVRDTQLVEQLVEVPTIVSFSSLQRTMEQHVDIPVPRRRRGETLVFKVFFPDRVQQRRSCLWNAFLSGLRSRSLIFLFLVETFKIIAQDRVSSSSSHVPARDQEGLDEPGEGFFLTLFPKFKTSAKLGPHSSPTVPASVSSSTLAAQLEDAPVPDSNEWVQFLFGGKSCDWNRRTNATVWQSPPGVNVVWVGMMDEDGVPYYWHRDTRVSRYGVPPLPPG